MSKTTWIPIYTGREEEAEVVVVPTTKPAEVLYYVLQFLPQQSSLEINHPAAGRLPQPAFILASAEAKAAAAAEN